ncbi:MAG TPA: HAD-IA family hydrolase [Gemmatimonadales bacterium]|jgi:pyrophosphatase PpaX
MPDAAVRTFLFDLDGTLLDSIDLIMSSYRHTMEHHVGTVPPDDVWLAGLGTPLWKQFRAFTDDDAEIERMVETYRDHNLAHHDAMVRNYPGIRDVVTALSERGVRLGIVTSKKREGSFRGLDLAALRPFFPVVVSADDVERHKPDPEPVRLALHLLDADAASAVFVGDSPHDMAAGRAAGVRTAAAMWGPFPRAWLEPHGPDYWLCSPTDLLSLPLSA